MKRTEREKETATGSCTHAGVEVRDLGSGGYGLDCPYCGEKYEHATTLLATAEGNTMIVRKGVRH